MQTGSLRAPWGIIFDAAWCYPESLEAGGLTARNQHFVGGFVRRSVGFFKGHDAHRCCPTYQLVKLWCMVRLDLLLSVVSSGQ